MGPVSPLFIGSVLSLVWLGVMVLQGRSGDGDGGSRPEGRDLASGCSILNFTAANSGSSIQGLTSENTPGWNRISLLMDGGARTTWWHRHSFIISDYRGICSWTLVTRILVSLQWLTSFSNCCVGHVAISLCLCSHRYVRVRKRPCFGKKNTCFVSINTAGGGPNSRQ